MYINHNKEGEKAMDEDFDDEPIDDGWDNEDQDTDRDEPEDD